MQNSWISSTEIAAIIGRSHDLILGDIEDFSRNEIYPEGAVRKIDYPNFKYNITQRFYLNTIIIDDFSKRYPDTIMRRLKERANFLIAAEAGFNKAREDSKDGYKEMSAALKEYYIINEPEDASSEDYMKEARLIRFVFQGSEDPIERDYLSASDLSLLCRLERMNSTLILLGESYKTRKYKLREYGISARLLAEKIAYLSSRLQQRDFS